MCAGEKEKICVYFGLSTVAAVASSVTEMLNKAIFARLSLSLCVMKPTPRPPRPLALPSHTGLLCGIHRPI